VLLLLLPHPLLVYIQAVSHASPTYLLLLLPLPYLLPLLLLLLLLL